MKKIFTLLFTMAFLGAAFAQPGQRNSGNHNSNVVYVNNQHDNSSFWGYYFTPRERDIQLDQINSNYNFKIQSVRHRLFMSRYEKRRVIRQLEAQRSFEIQAVHQKFNDRRNQFDDQDRKNKKYKKNKRHNW